MAGPHISLYYDGFREFADNCGEVDVTAIDSRFTEDFVLSMSGSFPNEHAVTD